MYLKHMPKTKKNSHKTPIKLNLLNKSSISNMPSKENINPKKLKKSKLGSQDITHEDSFNESFFQKIEDNIKESLQRDFLECQNDPTLFSKNKIEWIYEDLDLDPKEFGIEDYHDFQDELIGRVVHSDDSRFEDLVGNWFCFFNLKRII